MYGSMAGEWVHATLSGNEVESDLAGPDGDTVATDLEDALL